MTDTQTTAGYNAPALPALTRFSLARLRELGSLSPSAWEAALSFCGFVPDRRDWFAYWRQIFLLGGALFFLAGVIFFIAANWGEMHRFMRMALVGALVAASGIFALAKGLDTPLGRVLLLSCGIAMGPMLAVFGQTYQTGVELWELFRVWTALLILLAVCGKQAGLWFAAWLSGNVFVMLWLGRGMGEPLEALGMFSSLPESLVALALAVAGWEWAAWKLRGREAYAWLESRWLPRLLFFDLTCRITGYLVLALFGGYPWRSLPELFLPHAYFIPLLGLVIAGAVWFWRRKRTPDLFMPAVLLGALAVLFVSLLVKVEFLFDGGVNAILIWGLIITGITAGIGKLLLLLQHSLEKDAGTLASNLAHRTEGAAAFFARFRQGITWESLWAHLRARGELAEDAPLPDVSVLRANASASPWYVRAMLAFGGWVAALLFMVFLVLLLFMTLHIRSNEGQSLFGIGAVVMAVGAVAVARPGIFLRNFGFALALTGAGCAATGFFIMLNGGRASFFLVAVFLLTACFFVNSGVFRFLAAMTVSCCLAAGLALLGFSGDRPWWSGEGESAFALYWAAYVPVIWWGFLSVGFALFHLREKTWRGTSWGRVAEPVFFGMFAGMLACQIAALSMRFNFFGHSPYFSGSARAVALGSAAGLVFLAWLLVKKRTDDAERGFVVFCAGAGIPLAWFLPGAALAFYGLAMARFIGSVVMQGMIAAYFFLYMTYYYYFLGVTLFTKSLLLGVTGLLMLSFAYCLGKFAAGFAPNSVNGKDSADGKEKHA
ncbi:MAG: hypothetical protein DELT_00911 [Desulfovibrio sp.]